MYFVGLNLVIYEKKNDIPQTSGDLFQIRAKTKQLM